MAAVTAGMVKELREMTGAGMMDCKKALAATDGAVSYTHLARRLRIPGGFYARSSDESVQMRLLSRPEPLYLYGAADQAVSEQDLKAIAGQDRYLRRSGSDEV